MDFKSIAVVGLGIASDHNQPNFFDDVLRGILQAAGRYDRDVTIVRRSLWEWPDHPPIFSQDHYLGIIVLGPSFPETLIKGAEISGLPTVTIGGANECPEFSSVDVDNYNSARAAVQHLIDIGHKRIGYISGTSIAGWAAERHRAYVDAMISANLVIEESLIASVDFAGVNEGYDAMRRLLDDDVSDRPSAVATVNDDTAQGALNKIYETGLRVPIDISVVGFDDNQNSASALPPLTTIRQPKHAIGTKVVETLMAAIINPALPPEHVAVPGELIIRASTNRVRRK